MSDADYQGLSEFLKKIKYLGRGKFGWNLSESREVTPLSTTVPVEPSFRI
jgi:hypothetical protein